MQIITLHKNIYKIRNSFCTAEAEKHIEKYQSIISKWKRLKDLGLKDKEISEVSEISRSSYYRARIMLQKVRRGYIPPSKRPKKLNKPRWGESEKQLVLQIRRENPTYGKAKIAVILKRDHGLNISESTVGRILKRLMEKGLVTKSISAPRMRKKRNFNGKHAQAWTYKDYGSIEIGERLQIDHMSVTRNNIRMKHFQAWDRKSKFIHAAVYTNATSASAKKFLMELLEKCPFPIKSIQVDGGSEFMDKFEAACRELGLDLIVLPPAKPEYNGGTERGNRIFREEFYESHKFRANSLGEAKFELTKALQKYNSYRPHHNLDGLTPFQYIDNYFSGVTICPN
jgi:transposase InsO family protein